LQRSVLFWRTAWIRTDLQRAPPAQIDRTRQPDPLGECGRDVDVLLRQVDADDTAVSLAGQKADRSAESAADACTLGHAPFCERLRNRPPAGSAKRLLNAPASSVPVMQAQTENSSVFVVHLWSVGGLPTGFRAVVRRVDHEQSEFFTQAAALTAYFQREARSGCIDARAPRAPSVDTHADAARPASQTAGPQDASSAAPAQPPRSRAIEPGFEVPSLLHVDFDAYKRRAQQLRREECSRILDVGWIGLVAAGRALRERAARLLSRRRNNSAR
jgi:hypothetical protein